MRHSRPSTLLLHAVLWLCALAAGPYTIGAATAPDIEALDRYIEQARAEWKVPGLAVAIVKDGEVIHARGYGEREIGSRDQVDADTLFAIASNTKAFTAAALAVLVDEGKLHWDDRVVDHLPYFQLYDPYVTSEMRVRDLLCHRSGLGTYSGDLIWWGTSYSAEEVVRRARFLPPAGPFRAHYGYSNIMFIAAGEIVEKRSGLPYGEFLETRFFGPLEMRRTVTSVSMLPATDNVATPHGEVKGEIVAFPWQAWDNSVAAGGLLSSVADMSRWIELQLRRGELDNGSRLFSPAASSTMWSAHTPIQISERSKRRYPSTHFRAYGLGWVLMDFHGRRVIGHGGGYDGMISRVAMVPEENLGIVVLSNSMTGLPTALTYRILDAFLGDELRDWSATALVAQNQRRKRNKVRVDRAELERVEGTRPSLGLERYAGLYGSEMYGQVVVTNDDGLQLRFLPNPDLAGTLRHLHYDTFVIEWNRPFPFFGKGTVQFLLDSTARVSEMKIDIPNDDLWFNELALLRESPD